MSSTRSSKLLWLGIFVCALSGYGCVAVQPYERGMLSNRVMNANPDLQELKSDGHVQEYREGSIGGTGLTGAGCGCN